MPRPRIRAILLGLTAFLVVVLVAAQFLLPGIAERRVRDELSGSGTVSEVHVHAFPAIKLIWHHADRVTVRMTDYTSSPGTMSDRIGEAAHVGRLDASAARVKLGPLVLHDARLAKRDERLTGSATLRTPDLARALPPGATAVPIASGGKDIVVAGSLGAFGLSISSRARVTALDGAVVLEPEGLPLAGLATFDVFRSPHVSVTSLGSRPLPGAFRLSATGRASG